MNQWLNESMNQFFSPHPPQHHHRNYKSNNHDRAANHRLTDALRRRRSEIAADDSADGHQKRRRPGNQVRNRKSQYSHTVDADAEKILDAIRAMYVVQTEQAHGGEHPNAISRAEVSAVHR